MSAACGPVDPGLGVVGARERPVVAVGVAVVVLRPGAEGARERLAVDRDFLVALAPPDQPVVGDLVDRADDLAFARRIEDVRVEGRPGVAGERPPLGPQVVIAGRERAVADAQEELHGVGDPAAVRQAQVHRLRERHRQPARHPAGAVDREEQVFVGIDAGAAAEEIAERGFDGPLAVEEDLEDEEAVSVVGARRIAPVAAFAGADDAGRQFVDGLRAVDPGDRGGFARRDGQAGGDPVREADGAARTSV